MPDYSRGKIYKITAGELTYIGSTCEPTLARRLSKHVGDYKCWKNGTRKFITSFPLIETGGYEITLIELCPCTSRDELIARERFHIESTVCVNRQITGRTKKEWCEANADKLREQWNTYQEANKDTIHEYQKVYRLANKDTARERQKAYVEANADKIREQTKAYQEANKDTILEYQNAYREAHKDTIREYAKAYRLANKDELKRKREAKAKIKSEANA
jgi:hypothetical protein